MTYLPFSGCDDLDLWRLFARYQASSVSDPGGPAKGRGTHNADALVCASAKSRGLVVKRSYYFGIDIVRFACALAVAAFHIGFSCWASPTSGGAKLLQHSYTLPDLAGLLWPGWVGVEIFFVISGFVISGSAEKANAVSFVKGRMLRLYPAAWICATITMVVLLINHHARAKAYLSSLLLFPGGPWIDGQYWTLGVEIIFYALVFLLMVFGRKNLIYALAAVIGVASTLTTVAIFLGADQLTFLSRGVWRLTLLNYGADFALGIMIHAWASGRMDRWKLALSAIFLVGIAAEIHEHTAGMSGRVTNSPIVLIDRWELALVLFLVGLVGILLSVRYGSLLRELRPLARRGVGPASQAGTGDLSALPSALFGRYRARSRAGPGRHAPHPGVPDRTRGAGSGRHRHRRVRRTGCPSRPAFRARSDRIQLRRAIVAGQVFRVLTQARPPCLVERHATAFPTARDCRPRDRRLISQPWLGFRPVGSGSTSIPTHQMGGHE
jgi:exopolysaccharide production protein ExoZ